MASYLDQSDLIAAIVEGVFETPLWSSFLDKLRAATGADYAILNFRPPGRPFAEAITLLSNGGRFDVRDVNLAMFPPGDPPVDETLIEGDIYTFDELLGERASIQSRIYRDFLIQLGVSRIRHMRIQEHSGVNAWLTIARHGDEDFVPCDDLLMQSVARVLRGTMRHYVALERERFEGQLTAEPVRRLAFGWIALDATGQVLASDSRGSHMLAHSGVLGRNANGRLTATPKRVEHEIFRALERVTRNPRCRAQALPLSHSPWLDMLLLPAHRGSIAAKATPAVIAYVHGDNWQADGRYDELAQLFGLTPQEARLALALCRGLTIAEAAAELRLSVGTARNYSKAIFAKTGTHGQSDLVRIIMRSVLAIAIAPEEQGYLFPCS